jgi:hypothetical protein
VEKLHEHWQSPRQSGSLSNASLSNASLDDLAAEAHHRAALYFRNAAKKIQDKRITVRPKLCERERETRCASVHALEASKKRPLTG